MECRQRLESSIFPIYYYKDSVNSYTKAVTSVSYVAQVKTGFQTQIPEKDRDVECTIKIDGSCYQRKTSMEN